MADPASMPLRDLVLRPDGWPSMLTKAHPPGLYLLQRGPDEDGSLIVVTSYGDTFLSGGSAVGTQCYEPPYTVTPVRLERREVELG